MGDLTILGDCKKLFKLVLEFTNNHPQFRYNLNDQVIRSCISIGSNIAEGSEKSKIDFSRYLDISVGSCNELKFQLELYEGNKSEMFDIISKIKGTCIKLKMYNRRIGV